MPPNGLDFQMLLNPFEKKFYPSQCYDAAVLKIMRIWLPRNKVSHSVNNLDNSLDARLNLGLDKPIIAEPICYSQHQVLNLRAGRIIGFTNNHFYSWALRR